MKKLIAIFILLVTVSINSYSQIGWMSQQSGISAPINSLYFINNMTGWLCGYAGVISKTTNGGLNWNAQVSGTTYNLYAIHFVDGNTGWAAGGDVIPNVVGRVMIVKTTNGGANWFIQMDSGSDFNFPYNLTFFDANTGFAACYGFTDNVLRGLILKTTNGGTNWQIMPGTKNTKKVVFTNSNTGYYISKVWEDYNNIDSGIVYKTTNSGLNWNISFTKYLHQLKNIVFFNQNTGIIQATIDTNFNNYRYYKTTDAGSSWQLISTGATYHTTSFFNNESTGWAVGSQILRTTNGGVNWNVNLNNPSSTLNCITFADLQKGWSAGYNGVLYSTVVVDTTSGNYFPLQVGNVYKYYTWDFPYPNSGTYSKARITKDTIAFGNRYFYCYNFPYILNGWVRYDSLSGLLLHFYPGNGCGTHTNEKIIDSLTAKLNNTLNYCPYSTGSLRRCSDTSNTTLFGYYTTKIKSFAHDGLAVSGITYARNIGISNYGSGEPPPISHYVDLKGCYVNGVMYGDTLLTNINQISSEVPASYSLSQNYPNPFNSICNVQFSMCNAGDVKLVVYDVQGREVQTLVNERLQAGTYEAKFDGAMLNSGVYFYRITTGNYSETKRMILLK